MLPTCELSSHYDGVKQRLCPENFVIWERIDGDIFVIRCQVVER